MDLNEKLNVGYRHPWELARAKSMLNLVDSYINRQSTIADIGAGDMFFTKQLTQLTESSIYAVDRGYLDPATAGQIVTCRQINLLPDNSIDCMVLMDVLEHVENEHEFLAMLNTKIKRNGIFIITVPAFQFLYTSHDQFLNHYRRYSKTALINVLCANDLQLERSFYFYTSLFFIRLLQSFKEKTIGGTISHIGMWQYADTAICTQLLKKILDLDFYLNQGLNKLNIDLIGLSVLAVARKK